jgi:hypothetical protein
MRAHTHTCAWRLRRVREALGVRRAHGASLTTPNSTTTRAHTLQLGHPGHTCAPRAGEQPRPRRRCVVSHSLARSQAPTVTPMLLASSVHDAALRQLIGAATRLVVCSLNNASAGVCVCGWAGKGGQDVCRGLEFAVQAACTGSTCTSHSGDTLVTLACARPCLCACASGRGRLCCLACHPGGVHLCYRSTCQHRFPTTNTTNTTN